MAAYSSALFNFFCPPHRYFARHGGDEQKFLRRDVCGEHNVAAKLPSILVLGSLVSILAFAAVRSKPAANTTSQFQLENVGQEEKMRDTPDMHGS